MQPQIQEDIAHYMDSPYADFGNDHNGFHFLDGTSEPDVSLTELLGEVFNNNDDFSGEESNCQKNPAVGSETDLSGHRPPVNFRVMDSGICHGADTEMAQVQVKIWSYGSFLTSSLAACVWLLFSSCAFLNVEFYNCLEILLFF